MQSLEISHGYVVVNYNNSLITNNLIQSLKTQNIITKFPIVIVDNISDEENIKILNDIIKKEDNVHVEFSKVNLGYFKGLNRGIAYLKNNFPEINCIIIGNNDLIFPKDFTDNIFQKSSLFTKYPIISPNVITSDGIHQNPHVINKISIFRELVYDLYYSNYILASIIVKLSTFTKRISDRSDEAEYRIPRQIYQGHGSCYILGPLFLSNFSELLAPTFLFGEEFFLSIQLKSKNFQVYYEPSIQVIHACHSTIHKMPGKTMWRYGKIAHKEYRKYIKLSSLFKL